jgi:lipopolysaccharide transport system permease protein
MSSQLDSDLLEPWTLIIGPRRSWCDLRLRELWTARDLIRLFVWRDFVSVHKQTILGPLWHVLQPLLMTAMFTVVFGRIAGLPADGAPHFTFYMTGIVLWTFFANCVSKTSNTFITNAALFGKVYFPRLAVPVSIVASNLVTLAIQLGLLASVLAWQVSGGAAVHPNAWVLGAPAVLLLVGAAGSACGILVSALTTRYRDLQQLVAFGLQLSMYASPVIYPLSAVGPRYRWLLAANPLTAPIEFFRYAVLGAGDVSLAAMAYSAVVIAVLLAGAVVMFSRVEGTFIDSI